MSAAADPLAMPGSRRLRVLVADDHALFREGLVVPPRKSRNWR